MTGRFRHKVKALKHFVSTMAKKLRQKHRINKKKARRETFEIKKAKKLSKAGYKNTNRNQVLYFLENSEFNKNVKPIMTNKKTAKIDVPKNFSFSENPDETIETLQKLLYISDKNDINLLEFDHCKCENLEIGASTVMDVILLNILSERERKRNKNRLDVGGEYPRETMIEEILNVSGILKHLNINNKDIENKNIRKLDLITGGKGYLNIKNKQSFRSGPAATKITRYYKECLNSMGLIINQEGQRLVGLLLGEVINNCEIHCEEFCKWYTLGHYSINEAEKYGECHLVFFNFGQTIYEGLKNNTTSEKILNELKNMSRLHSGFLGIGGWDEECLWTLYALQEGVSRKWAEKDNPTIGTGPDRGTGTIKFIDSFQQIGHTENGKKPIMSITSGHTHILYTDEYKLKEENFTGGKRRVIAFNKDNDLKKPPDPKYVKKLKNYFPGTIISMKFYIDRDYISKKIKEANNDN